jgi:GMP synthase-like glutamine amidotransferase
MTNGAEDRLQAIIIEHERVTPGGLIETWLRERGAEVEILRIDVEERAVDPREYGLLVSLGSEHPAYADHLKWIKREARLLEQAVDADIPVLGVCFGGQLLAQVMGGETFRADAEEIGWLPVRTREPDLVPEGPWFQWHFDTFTIPSEARLLAESDAGPQAFAIGRSLGIQFHPEVTNEIMEEWVRVYPHELEEHGVDPARLLVETRERIEEAHRTSRKLLESYLERVAQAGARG